MDDDEYGDEDCEGYDGCPTNNSITVAQLIGKTLTGGVITAPVVGNYYATGKAQDAYRRITRTPKEAHRLTMKFDPGNKFDVNAIGVYQGDTMLGHLDRSSAARVTELVHTALDSAKMSRLSKTQYELLADTTTVGERVYVTIIGCSRIQ